MGDLPIRKRIRLPDYDYSQEGMYFITVCAKNNKKLFGDITFPEVPVRCSVELSEHGKLVDESIRNLHTFYDSVEVDKYIIMPNHIHLIIAIGHHPKKTTPTISGMMNMFKGGVTKKAGVPLWQKSFHEHVIRNGEDYLRIWEYIDTNDVKWALDKYYSE